MFLSLISIGSLKRAQQWKIQWFYDWYLSVVESYLWQNTTKWLPTSLLHIVSAWVDFLIVLISLLLQYLWLRHRRLLRFSMQIPSVLSCEIILKFGKSALQIQSSGQFGVWSGWSQGEAKRGQRWKASAPRTETSSETNGVIICVITGIINEGAFKVTRMPFFFFTPELY